MSNLLVGNGLLIQFGGIEYTNKYIVLRTLENFEKDDFPKGIIVNSPILAKVFFAKMFATIPYILRGDYDSAAICSSERMALELFIEKYKKYSSLQMSDIGFEDYYLICDLLCHKTHTINPEQFYIRESLRLSFMHAIYNEGNLCKIHQNFPTAVSDFLKSYEKIYTTNYDNNIEQVTSKNVIHIHGYFYERSDVYKPNSFRNQLGDHPFENYEIDDDYFYLYSTAISAHCGDYKKSYMEQTVLANQAIEKMATAYENNANVRIDVDSWKDNDNPLVARLYDAIQLKRSNPNIKMSEPYCIDEFQNMKGHLDVVGLSPYNDFHIFDAIDKNDGVSSITYYYYSNDECNLINEKLKKHNLVFKSVCDLWEELK